MVRQKQISTHEKTTEKRTVSNKRQLQSPSLTQTETPTIRPEATLNDALAPPPLLVCKRTKYPSADASFWGSFRLHIQYTRGRGRGGVGGGAKTRVHNNMLGIYEYKRYRIPENLYPTLETDGGHAHLAEGTANLSEVVFRDVLVQVSDVQLQSGHGSSVPEDGLGLAVGVLRLLLLHRSNKTCTQHAGYVRWFKNCDEVNFRQMAHSRF